MLVQVLTAIEVLDDPNANGQRVCELFDGFEGVHAEFETVTTRHGKTDVVKITILADDGSALLLGIVGQLGGVGARPETI